MPLLSDAPELLELQERIRAARADLEQLLEQERRIKNARAEAEGCTCSYIAHDYRVSRLVSAYCKAEHRPRGQ